MLISTKLTAKIVNVSVALAGILMIGQAGYIHAKAELAQILIAKAYSEQTASVSPIANKKPWPWADTSVVAKLTIKKQDSFILSGANGRNLAFGPTHMAHTAIPGNNGNSVIVGHRDTHFAHLQNVQLGETISIEERGKKIDYRVSEIAVVNETDVKVAGPMQQTALTLITCYPFNDVSPNPTLRYVVRAIKIS